MVFLIRRVEKDKRRVTRIGVGNDPAFGPFKKDVGAAIVEMLEPIQAEYHRIRADRAYMDAVMKAGAEKASERAAVTLKKAYEAVGFVTRP